MCCVNCPDVVVQLSVKLHDAGIFQMLHYVVTFDEKLQLWSSLEE